ncbi:MAG TPA: metalloregulator ArsR/SmtB family transcription factor [Sandaracinaceae bacterium]
MPASLAGASSLLSLLADPTRVRLMSLLAREELSVAELTQITELAQSRVSTHLGKLREAGLVTDRRQGASTFYRASEAMPQEARSLWTLLEAQLDDRVLDSDRERCEALVRAREAAWPDAVAGQMERHYSPGRTWEATARGLLGLVRFGDVLDAGSGDGTLAALIAPRARSVTCLDRSETVLAAAAKRLAGHDNVRFAHGDLLELPFADRSFDHVMLFNVLTYALDPERALREAARVLRKRGLLAIVTLARHQHASITAAYGHVVPGFEPKKLAKMIERAGLTVDSCEITSRERRKPYFEIVSAFASK